MPEEAARSKSARENRLLLITIVVSVALLMLLARFRFPAQERTEVVAPAAPLERLAARATFDELAAIIRQVGERLTDAVLVLRVSSPRPPEFGLVPEMQQPGVASVSYTRFVPAIYVTPDTAVARLRPDDTLQGLVGRDDMEPVVVATDPVRKLAVVRVPTASEEVLAVWEQGPPFQAPSYIALAEGTRGGTAWRPMFVGRTNPFNDARWARPLLEAGALPLTPAGSLAFSLQGNFLGMIVLEEGFPAIAPAVTLSAESLRLLEEGDRSPAAAIGLEVQDLTRDLAATVGTETGVIVSYVDPAGPSANAIQVGDAVVSIEGQPLLSAERFGVVVARLVPGTTLTVGVKRKGEETREVTIEAVPLPKGGAAAAGLGLTLRSVPRVGCEVIHVAPGSAAARAGIQGGDLVTHLEGAAAPTAVQISRAYSQIEPGESLILGLRRRNTPFVAAVGKPPESEG